MYVHMEGSGCLCVVSVHVYTAVDVYISCMYIWPRRVYLSLYKHTYNYIYMSNHVLVSPLLYVHVYIYMYICVTIHTCMYICMYVYIYTCMYIYMYMYKYTYAHIHTHIYIYIYIHQANSPGSPLGAKGSHQSSLFALWSIEI